MSLDTHQISPTPPGPGTLPASTRNVGVIGAITGHHTILVNQMRMLTAAVVAGARSGEYDLALSRLMAWFSTEFLPHAHAEEVALYRVGSRLESTRLLVDAMVAGHRALKSLMTDLTYAGDPLTVTAATAAAQAVFTVHLAKENDLLLPALDAAAVDLEQALAGRLEIIGGQSAPDELDARALPHSERHDIIFANSTSYCRAAASSSSTITIPSRCVTRQRRCGPDGSGGATWNPDRSSGGSRSPVPPEATGHEAVDGLTRVLACACGKLARAGQPEEAGWLAADAWALLHHTNPVQAQRLDGTMHHVALLEQKPEATPLPHREEPTMPVTDRIVDVRTEIPRIRHQLIFETFASLEAGTAFVLVNDHDPKPLYYQLAAETAGEFSWDYLEEGPEVWQIRIGRLAAA